jgi:tetratricopeptide (TPR) repeat protein
MNITIPFKAIPLCLVILLSLCSDTFSQHYGAEANRYQKLGDSLEKAKQYKLAARHFQAEGKLRKMIAYKKQAAVNAGYSYAMAEMPDSALICFEDAVIQFGLTNSNWLDTEPSLAQVRKLERFGKLRKRMSDQESTQHDPGQAKFLTSDINLFWKAYDIYKKDSANAERIFLTEYFEKGSPDLQEYFRIKTPNIGGLKGFVRNIKTMPRFYESIRANTEEIVHLEDSMRVIYRNLKNWYEPSIFPNTTFVIGAWSSGGTVTNYGSILGSDMYAAATSTPISELNLWQQKNLNQFAGLKNVVAHELVHVQQSQMAGDTTLLCHAIQEGMADFIGELISGKTANERLHVWAVGHERQVWEEFKKEMFLDRYSNWIANSNQETAERPSDLGYWVGYQICKAYFDQAADKKQAIHVMLNIQDYRAFLTKSKVDERLMGK